SSTFRSAPYCRCCSAPGGRFARRHADRFSNGEAAVNRMIDPRAAQADKLRAEIAEIFAEGQREAGEALARAATRAAAMLNERAAQVEANEPDWRDLKEAAGMFRMHPDTILPWPVGTVSADTRMAAANGDGPAIFREGGCARAADPSQGCRLQ